MDCGVQRRVAWACDEFLVFGLRGSRNLMGQGLLEMLLAWVLFGDTCLSQYIHTREYLLGNTRLG